MMQRISVHLDQVSIDTADLLGAIQGKSRSEVIRELVHEIGLFQLNKLVDKVIQKYDNNEIA